MKSTKKIKLVRYGGLSSINHKQFYKQDSYHSPPVKNGIYAFIFPYIEDFLWIWKTKSDLTDLKFIRKNRRTFLYNGFVWVHWIDKAMECGYGIKYKKSWVKIHTDDLNILFKKVQQNDRLYLKMKNNINPIKIPNPYKRGLNGFMSRDHLEVFIEKV